MFSRFTQKIYKSREVYKYSIIENFGEIYEKS